MKRQWRVLVFCTGMTWLLAGEQLAAQETPTLMPTETWTPTATWTATPTWTSTPTWTATATWTATWTPVIQTVVVTQPPLVITQPPIVVTGPPVIIVQPPDVPAILATLRPTVVPPTFAPPPTLMTPFYGWRRYQSIYFIPVIGLWRIVGDVTASAQQYRTSSSARAVARYPFTGDGIRLAYRAHPQGCLFDVAVDAGAVDSVDSLAAEVEWRLAGPYFLTGGYHVLDIRSQAQTGGVCSVDVDYLEVFSGPPMPELALTAAAPAATMVPAQDVAQIMLISAPPTPLPTPTPVPMSVISLAVQVSYDANASDTADPNEGVQGVSVRVINAATGALLNSGFTDVNGTLRFQVVSTDEIMVHIPLLARSLNIRPTRGKTTEQTWEVLLPPANQPAVIP